MEAEAPGKPQVGDEKQRVQMAGGSWKGQGPGKTGRTFVGRLSLLELPLLSQALSVS